MLRVNIKIINLLLLLIQTTLSIVQAGSLLSRNPSALPQLQDAIIRNDIEKFASLIRSTAYAPKRRIQMINELNSKGETALHVAAASPLAQQFIDMMLPESMDPAILSQIKYVGSHNGRFYPLFYAVRNDDIEVFPLLQSRLANVPRPETSRLNDEWAQNLFNARKIQMEMQEARSISSRSIASGSLG